MWALGEVVSIWDYPDFVTLPKGAVLFVYKTNDDADNKAMIWAERYYQFKKEVV